MKIILLKDVKNVGRQFEVKVVADGHAMNSLIPNRLAEIATPKALKRLELTKKQNEGTKKVRDDLVVKNIDDLKDVTIEITGKGNDKGHLFASVHNGEIVEALKEQTGLDVDASHIILEKPLKTAGDHEIKVKVGEKEGKFKVVVKVE